jgi:hypothetical protein
VQKRGTGSMRRPKTWGFPDVNVNAGCVKLNPSITSTKQTTAIPLSVPYGFLSQPVIDTNVEPLLLFLS